MAAKTFIPPNPPLLERPLQANGTWTLSWYQYFQAAAAADAALAASPSFANDAAAAAGGVAVGWPYRSGSARYVRVS